MDEMNYLSLWLQYKNGKITLKEFEEKTSVTQYLNIDWNKEKIKSTVYFEEINNFSDSVSCFIISKKSSNFFEQLEGFKKVNPLKSEYNCIGIYKNIPIITTDNLKENEVYALYKGKQQFDVEPIFVKGEMKGSSTDDNK